MTVGQDPQEPRHEGAVGALTDLGSKLVTALPPSLIALMLINLAFLGLTYWFLTNQMEGRTKLASVIIDRCLADMAKLETIGSVEARLDALEHDVRALEVGQRKP